MPAAWQSDAVSNREGTRPLFVKSLRIEKTYAMRLRRVAATVADFIHAHNDPAEPVTSGDAIQAALVRYAVAVIPWAQSVGNRMIAEVDARNKMHWHAAAKRISAGLADEIENAPTGEVMRALLAAQVDLITSLPREAAQQVHELVTANRVMGLRAELLTEKIRALGEITKSRAKLIAITETSRAGAVLTQARAESIDSTEYFWRSAGDASVRPDHRALNGRVFKWASPPISDTKSGTRAHPGCIWRCRCYAEPIF